MADDGSTQSEGGGAVAGWSVVTSPWSAATTDVEFDAQLREAARVLRRGGQRSMAVLALILVGLRPHAALWLLDARLQVVHGNTVLLDGFCRCIRGHIRRLQHAGDEEHEVCRVFRRLVLWAAQRAAGLFLAPAADDDAYRNGGFGAVPATAAAVRSLEKQTFRAAAAAAGDAITECGICFADFVDGAEVRVMPCPCRGHRFHPECITKWLGISNGCPLCRHKLPTTGVSDQ